MSSRPTPAMKRTTVMLPADLRRRAFVRARERGVSLGELIRESLASALPTATPVRTDEQSALALLRKLADQEASFTDRVSFALMRRHKLSRAFAFDRHFTAAGFTVWP